MQNLKRALSLILVVAMVASFMVAAIAAPAEQLTDLSESNFQPEVRVLNALGIVEGYEDGTYKPANEVTRAELALILARVRVGGDKDMIATYNYSHMNYTDILNAGYTWAASGIQYCTDNGMVVGDGNGKYRPGDTVTIVEALKMLLTALGYDAEIEGLQNVGAAWKANTLSLAKEVGLMDRFYGDTNKNCTRDDIALLIYNFLMSKVVKGYYTNDVANVDTVLYAGGTALEIYFQKQVIYGVVVANETADLDVYEYAQTGMVKDNDVTLGAGYTQLFLYEDDENGFSLADYLGGTNAKAYDKVTKGSRNKAAAWQDALDNAFVTVKLSTGLEDLGESVFVITDLEKSKGYYVAVGNTCFDTGVNKIGVEQWSAANLNGLTNADTIYVNDYDITLNVIEENEQQSSTRLLNSVTAGNGDFLKTVDFDGDGKLDFVMVEDWAMAKAYGATKKGAVANSANLAWNVNTNMAKDSATAGVVNFHYADGTYYVVAAKSLSKLTLEDSKNAVNFKEGYIALTDGNKYYQSDVEIQYYNDINGVNGMTENTWVAPLLDDIMDCEKDPYNLISYTWYLDCGGFIRAYGMDADEYDMYLLTDGTSKQSGRASYTKTVDTYKESNKVENYKYATVEKYDFVKDDELPYGGALINTAVNGKAITNLVAGAVENDTITVGDISRTGNHIVELRSEIKANTYSTTDSYGKYGDYNVNNNGSASEYVYTTTDTDYYYVVLAKDAKGETYVKSVEYFDGYLNVKGFNFNNCEVAYAAVTDEKDAYGNVYYYANAVVFETYEKLTTTSYPYFSFAHVSGNKDAKTGIYDVITPAGELGTYDVNSISGAYLENVFGALGFFTYNETTGAAEKIVENWAKYGISAHIVAISKTGKVDYLVLDEQGGEQIKVTEETPVYAVMNETTDKSGRPTWTVKKYEDSIKAGDMITVVKAPNGAIEYIVVFYSPSYDLGWGEDWAFQITMDDQHTLVVSEAACLYLTILDGGHLYADDAKYLAFVAAVKAYAADKTEKNLDAMIAAFDVLVDSLTEEKLQEMLKNKDEYLLSFFMYVGITEDLLERMEAFEDMVEASYNGAGMIVIDPYLYDLKGLYDSFTATQLEFGTKYFESFKDAVHQYTELKDTVVATAEKLMQAAEDYTKAVVPADKIVAAEAVKAAYDAYVKACEANKVLEDPQFDTPISNELAAAIALAKSL